MGVGVEMKRGPSKGFGPGKHKRYCVMSPIEGT
jgi:hypothetical protein